MTAQIKPSQILGTLASHQNTEVSDKTAGAKEELKRIQQKLHARIHDQAVFVDMALCRSHRDRISRELFQYYLDLQIKQDQQIIRDDRRLIKRRVEKELSRQEHLRASMGALPAITNLSSKNPAELSALVGLLNQQAHQLSKIDSSVQANVSIHLDTGSLETSARAVDNAYRHKKMHGEANERTTASAKK